MRQLSVAFQAIGLLVLGGCGSPPLAPLRMFVTQGNYEASVAAEKTICPGAAAAGAIPDGEHTVWVQLLRLAGVDSVSVSPIARVKAFDEDRWVDLSGNPLFDSPLELSSMRAPRSPLVQTQYAGYPVEAGEAVWTGMPPAVSAKEIIESAPLFGLCVGDAYHDFKIWSSTAATKEGYIGLAGADNLSWLGGSLLPCNERAHIYCIESRK